MLEYYEWEQLSTWYGLLFIKVAEPRKGTVVVGPFHGSFSECNLKGVLIPDSFSVLDCSWLADKMRPVSPGDVGPLTRMICGVIGLKEPHNLVNVERMDEFNREACLKGTSPALTLNSSRELAERLGWTAQRKPTEESND